MEFQSDHNTDAFSKTLPRNYNNPSMSPPQPVAMLAPPGKQIGKLEYFDLDHSNAPPICKTAISSTSTSSLSAAINSIGLPMVPPTIRNQNRSIGHGSSATTSAHLRPQPDGSSVGIPAGSDTGIVYKSVDFVKTEAFMRTRQDAEKNRSLKNRTKD